MENSNAKTRGFMNRLPDAAAVHSVVAAVRNLKAEEGNRITLFGYLMLACSLVAGTFVCRLLLL